MPSPMHNLLISDVSRLRAPGCVMPIAVRSCSKPAKLPLSSRHIRPPSATDTQHHHHRLLVDRRHSLARHTLPHASLHVPLTDAHFTLSALTGQ